jgi:hypothetical protein
MATTSLQSPGPGYRILRLSDGSSAWMPPEATTADFANAQQQGEALLAKKYQAQATQQNSPVTAGDKVYSATGVYPNTPFGHTVAWVDHNLGGNTLNRNPTVQAINTYAAPAVGAVNRVVTGALDAIPAVGLHDLIASGGNVVKHLATRAVPSLANTPDFYTAVGAARSLAGTPELSADAPAVQKILESTASTVANPSQSLARALLTNTTGYYGGKIGEEVAGEPGQYLGALLGATSPDAVKQQGAAFMHSYFGGDQGPEVMRAGQDTGVQPTFGMVANPEGRRIEKFFGAVPIFGRPVAQAKNTADTGIREAQIDVANQVYGGPLPGQHTTGGNTTTGVTPATIGSDLIEGTRQGSANITQQARDEQGNLVSNVGPDQPTNVRGVYYGPSGYSKQLTSDPGNYPSLAARLDNLRTMAIQQQTPQFEQKWGSMPAGTVPYARVQEARSNLGADLPGISGMAKGDQADLYAALTKAMRDAAVAKDPSLGPMFDYANENYQRIMGTGGQRDQLENIGGSPTGGYGGLAQPGGTTFGAPFTGGKDEGQAFNYLKSKLNSPAALEVLANPTVVPNDFWRQVGGAYYSTLGETNENTFRPEKMATAWRGTDPEVQSQLFRTPSGGSNQPALDTADDLATLGENTVLPQERAGLTNVAGAAVLGTKALDWLKASGGIATLGMPYLIAKMMENPGTVSTVATGPTRSLSDAIYSGLPAATQNITQSQNNSYSPSF